MCELVRPAKLDFPLFTNRDGVLLLLPSFFANATSQTGSVLRQKKEVVDGRLIRSLEEQPIERRTEKTIFSNLRRFLTWVEDTAADGGEIRVQTHHNLPSEVLNHYLEYLVCEEGLSDNAVDQMIMGLNSYYNWLSIADLAPNVKDIRLTRDCRAKARRNKNRRLAIKYLTSELRQHLYDHANSRRDRLLLRCAAETGVRTKELQSFRVNDFFYQGKIHPGLKSLFADAEQNPANMEFRYFLQGQYSKGVRKSGGKSRALWIHRSLLESMKQWFDNERPHSESDSFFVNHDGRPINERAGTIAFLKAKKSLMKVQDSLSLDGQRIEVDHTYHVLRHSFGTDLFNRLATEDGMDFENIVPTSRAYLETAKRMGHSTTGPDAPKTTATYIRTCHMKVRMEGGDFII